MSKDYDLILSELKNKIDNFIVDTSVNPLTAITNKTSSRSVLWIIIIGIPIAVFYCVIFMETFYCDEQR